MKSVMKSVIYRFGLPFGPLSGAAVACDCQDLALLQLFPCFHLNLSD